MNSVQWLHNMTTEKTGWRKNKEILISLRLKFLQDPTESLPVFLSLAVPIFHSISHGPP